MILIDTSGLLAAVDGRQRLHAAAAESLARATGPRHLSPFVLAELDYLIATRVGRHGQLALLAEVEAGAYRLEPFGADDVNAAREVLERYADLDIGLADASIVVLAERHDTGDVLTLDERRFRALRWKGRRRFTLLPADASGT